jgi:hypothetical protein
MPHGKNPNVSTIPRRVRSRNGLTGVDVRPFSIVFVHVRRPRSRLSSPQGRGRSAVKMLTTYCAQVNILTILRQKPCATKSLWHASRCSGRRR